MNCDNPSESNNMATRFQSQTVPFNSFFCFSLPLSVYFSHSLSLSYPHSLPLPWNPLSCPLIELGSPWTMVITLPEAITIKQRWPEILARSVLQRQEAVYMEPSKEPGDTHTRSSAFHRLAERGWGQCECGGRGLRRHWCVFTGSKLSGFTHMVWNVRKRHKTDVTQLHTENQRSGYTYCIQRDKEWRHDEERRALEV